MLFPVNNALGCLVWPALASNVTLPLAAATISAANSKASTSNMNTYEFWHYTVCFSLYCMVHA